MDNIIQIRDLTFAYAAGDEPVLSDINIDIGSGEFVIIMGSSGSGKTTLLKMLKRNMIPAGRYSGRVYIYGKEADKLTDRENAAGIGYVSQDPDNQIVTDKVWHELAFGLENLGMDNVTIRKKVAEMSEYFGITAGMTRKSASSVEDRNRYLIWLQLWLCSREYCFLTNRQPILTRLQR